MATDAIFRHGEPLMVDYTPAAGDLAAGQVVLVGNTTGWTCGIAHTPITNNTLGALAMGGGVYACMNINNSANGTKVWWDNTNKGVTTTSTNNALFGFIATGGAGGTNSTCRVRHFPYV